MKNYLAQNVNSAKAEQPWSRYKQKLKGYIEDIEASQTGRNKQINPECGIFCKKPGLTYSLSQYSNNFLKSPY